MIKAAIFDMDGLLINSEPFWQTAEVAVFNTVGVPLTVEMCAQTVGLRIEDAVQYWYRRYPWQNKSAAQVATEVVDSVIRQIGESGQLMNGVIEVLDFLQSKGIRLALASSSSYRIINTVVDTFQLNKYFEFVYSAEDEPLGKPHPGVYLSTAAKLGIDPLECIAFEDSVTGLVSARAARIKAVAVPEPHEFNKTKYDFADIKIPSLLVFGEKEWNVVNN